MYRLYIIFIFIVLHETFGVFYLSKKVIIKIKQYIPRFVRNQKSQ